MKTKILIGIGALICIAAADPAINQYTFSRAKVTAQIVDEQGSPISEAVVTFFFGGAHSTNAIVKTEVKTGSDGKAVGEGYSGGSYGASVTKEGYYLSGLDAPALVNIIDGRWQPWNPTAVTVLRPIVKPLPLYAKAGWLEIPAIGQPCGYDLEKGDWVTPYGKGAVADLVFTLERRYEDRQNFDVKVKLSFSQPLDGIQDAQLPAIDHISTFKWQRQAPSDGYQTIIETHFARDPKAGLTQSATEEQAYFFRVRTVEQNGQIIRACYGKIKGGLQLAPSNSKTCKIMLTYYLNPTSLDRNLEWNPKQNLLQGLSYDQTPREP